MNQPISITEINKLVSSPSELTQLNRLKITNTSTGYINNLKLIINEPTHLILEQSVTRERGSLSFNPEIKCLELGNLAPSETAYFEYKFFSNAIPNSLISDFSIIYTDDTNPKPIEKKVVEYLTDSTTS